MVHLSRLRRIALSLLKQEATHKLGIKNKRLRAGWDPDYLLKILATCTLWAPWQKGACAWGFRLVHMKLVFADVVKLVDTLS